MSAGKDRLGAINVRNRKYKFQVEETVKKGWTPVKAAIALGGLLLIIILVIVVILGRNRDKNDSRVVTYHVMDEQRLPQVELIWNGREMNRLSAYRELMDTALVSSCVAPMTGERTVDMQIDTKETRITGISYRVRAIGTEKLIEDGKIRNWEEKEGIISVPLTFSSLIEENTEYQMELILKTKEQGELSYHTRIYCGEQTTAMELFEFAEEFSAAALDKTAAEQVMVPYILTGESRNNEDLSHVDLYHKFSALTWGKLSPRLVGEREIAIHEISPSQLSLTFTYTLASEDEAGEISYFHVSEFFCVRLRNGKIFILDYARDAEEVFQGRKKDIQKAEIHLGIGDGSSELVNSPDGNYLTFVKNNQVWLMNMKEGRLQKIFAWEDDLTGAYRVQPVRVLDDGTADFLVYGYISQGAYEGSCQIQGYRYNKETGRLSMTFYVPVELNLSLLENLFGDVAHINEKDICYLLLDHTLYEISLTTGACSVISENLNKGSYCVNSQGNIIAWEEGTDLQMPERIQELNMDTGEIKTIAAKEKGYVGLAGFVGTDLVYGSNDRTAGGMRQDGTAVFPYQTVFIMNEAGELLRSYESGGDCILSVEASTNYITLEIGRLEEGGYKSLREEKLLSSQKDISGNYGTIAREKSELHLIEEVLRLKGMAGEEKGVSIKTVLPLVADETGFVLELEHPALPENGYYSFGRGELVTVSPTMAEAIASVYDCFGVVTGADRSMYWNRDARALYTNVSLNDRKAESKADVLAVCMQMMMEKEGLYYSDLKERLSKQTPEEILQDAFQDRMMDLQGCQVSALLYYINLGSPVLAVTGENSAMLLVGYDTSHVVVYDGMQSRYTMTIEEAETYFAERGSRFFSYLP